MRTLTINPAGPLKGTVTVPGDKSITHRAIVLSALAEGETTIMGYCRGEDCLDTARAFRAMGIEIQEAPGRLHVFGKGRWGLAEPDRPIDCGNSGTGIRLLAGLLAGQDFFTVLTGDESIRRRPMGRIVRPLRQMGATITGRKGGELAPLAVSGSRLSGITYESPVASAQVKSALLLAGLFAEGTTRVVEPQPSRDHTERMLRSLGVPIRVQGTAVEIDGRQPVGWGGERTMEVPGDLSAAAFFAVAASVIPGSDVTVQGVGVNPTRTGCLDILREMGGDLQLLRERVEGGEPVADLRIRSAPLRGVRIGADRIPRTIDEFPILFVAAALAEGDTEIRGAEELRHKESDRIATMASELRKLGARIEEAPDGVRIRGAGHGKTPPLKGGRVTSHGDHRVAMSLAVAALLADAPVHIDQADSIETSFPEFESKLLELLTSSWGGL